VLRRPIETASDFRTLSFGTPSGHEMMRYEYSNVGSKAVIMKIDKTFDVRTDTPPNEDPDKHSATLRAYHQILWSKNLPNGKPFTLDASIPGEYLFHESEIGTFSLSSDAIAGTFIFAKRMQHIIDQINEPEREGILVPRFNIGGFIIFPARKKNNKMTINGARGLNARIVDRFDLTLECIRRYYLSIESPLGEVFQRYEDFFKLFGSFENYVNFFLLQDLVNPKTGSVKFFIPFDDSFPSRPIPKSLEDYRLYIEKLMEFAQMRGERMEKFGAVSSE